MLADAAAGRLKSLYRSEGPSDLSGLPVPRYDLLDMRRFGLFNAFSVQGSRGCPFGCDFCSERFYMGSRYRHRPIPEIVEEIKSCGSRYFLFTDSNFGGKIDYAMH